MRLPPPFFFLLLFASASYAQGGDWELLYQVDGKAYGHDYASNVQAMDDLDGDGVPEILVSAPAEGLNREGVVRILSGVDGQELRRHTGTIGNGDFGWSAAVVGDLDSDGKRDYCIDAWNLVQPGAPPASGTVFAYSGATGLELWNAHGRTAHGGFGISISGGGDLSGDGIPDVLISEPRAELGGVLDAGQVIGFSGANGQELFRLQGGTQDGRFGWATEIIGDVTGDGMDDFLVSAIGETVSHPGSGALYAFAGDPTGAYTAAPLYVIGHPWNGAFTGAELQALPDVDGDGAGDFSTYHDDPADPLDFTAVYSGGTGALIHKPAWPGGLMFDMDLLSAVGDVDQDGDLELGAFLSSGRVILYDAASGAWEAEIPIPGGFLDAGAELVGGEDLDSDGLPELILGMTRGGLHDAGMIQVHSLDSFLQPDSLQVSAANGGVIRYDLAFPPDAAGDAYRILASASGISPTTLPGGVSVNLNADRVLHATWNGNYPAALQGGAGVLSGAATATATLTVAPGALPGALIGRTIHLAAACEPGTGLFRYASLSVPLEFLP